MSEVSFTSLISDNGFANCNVPCATYACNTTNVIFKMIIPAAKVTIATTDGHKISTVAAQIHCHKS